MQSIRPLIDLIAYDIVFEIVSSLHFTQNFGHTTFSPKRHSWDFNWITNWFILLTALIFFSGLKNPWRRYSEKKSFLSRFYNDVHNISKLLAKIKFAARLRWHSICAAQEPTFLFIFKPKLFIVNEIIIMKYGLGHEIVYYASSSSHFIE